MTGFIYPVIVAWTWGGGWLGQDGKGFHDAAGASVVHFVGGLAGFIGACIVGPRHGKEKDPATRKNVLQDNESQEWIKSQSSPRTLEWWIDQLQ